MEDWEDETKSTQIEQRIGDLEVNKRDQMHMDINNFWPITNRSVHHIFIKGTPGASGPPGSKGEKGDMVVSRVKGKYN